MLCGDHTIVDSSVGRARNCKERDAISSFTSKGVTAARFFTGRFFNDIIYPDEVHMEPTWNKRNNGIRNIPKPSSYVPRIILPLNLTRHSGYILSRVCASRLPFFIARHPLKGTDKYIYVQRIT